MLEVDIWSAFPTTAMLIIINLTRLMESEVRLVALLSGIQINQRH
jgi:hypothetical protein